jgi:hypothetical protein
MFQREFLRGSLAEWETARAGHGVQGQVALQGRVDPGLQGEPSDSTQNQTDLTGACGHRASR